MVVAIIKWSLIDHRVHAASLRQQEAETEEVFKTISDKQKKKNKRKQCHQLVSLFVFKSVSNLQNLNLQSGDSASHGFENKQSLVSCQTIANIKIRNFSDFSVRFFLSSIT